jgi:rhodanese-related sulfurtransferase
MKKILFILLAFISFYVLAFTPKEAYQLAKEGKAILIDVREESEIKEGMIDLAISFPLSKIENDPNWKNEFIQLTKGREIYLYCRSGARSGRVKGILKENKIESENLGGFMTLGTLLPTKKP